MTRCLKSLAAPAIALAIVACLATVAQAADPNGNWKWKFTTPDGQDIDIAMSLALDGQTLTGQIKHDGEAVEIKEGTFVDDNVAFHVVHEQDGNSLIAKFKGKCEADAITGKIEVEIGGDTLSFDWNATRDKS